MQNETTTALEASPNHKLLSQAIDKGDINMLERLMAMQEKWEKKEAEKKYNQAMSAAQSEITSVKATKFNNQTRSKYADLLDYDPIIRPAYTSKGLAISFDTAESPLPEHVRVIACITHEAGHKELRHIDIPADGKGAKGGDVMTKTHAVVAATTYGQRTLIRLIFNIATGDDDGNGASPKTNPLPFPNKNQWEKILEKFKTGEITTDQIEKNFRLNDSQKKELEKLINGK